MAAIQRRRGKTTPEKIDDRISFSHLCGFFLHHQVSGNSTTRRFRNEIHNKGLAKPRLEMINAQPGASPAIDVYRGRARGIVKARNLVEEQTVRRGRRHNLELRPLNEKVIRTDVYWRCVH